MFLRLADMPFSDMGISAIIDTDTGKYVSHTQVERCGTDSDYDESLFSGEKGKSGFVAAASTLYDSLSDT